VKLARTPAVTIDTAYPVATDVDAHVALRSDVWAKVCLGCNKQANTNTKPSAVCKKIVCIISATDRAHESKQHRQIIDIDRLN
jgi:hypothetical protein